MGELARSVRSAALESSASSSALAVRARRCTVSELGRSGLEAVARACGCESCEPASLATLSALSALFFDEEPRAGLWAAFFRDVSLLYVWSREFSRVCVSLSLSRYRLVFSSSSGETELCVALAAAAKALRGPVSTGMKKGLVDVSGAFCALVAATKTTRKNVVDASALRRHLAQLPLSLPAAGYGCGGERDDGGKPDCQDRLRAASRPMTQRQATFLVARFLDDSGDGVVTESEFSSFVFGAPRTCDALRADLRHLADSVKEQRGTGSAAKALFALLDRDGNGALGSQSPRARKRQEASSRDLGRSFLHDYMAVAHTIIEWLEESRVDSRIISRAFSKESHGDLCSRSPLELSDTSDSGRSRGARAGPRLARPPTPPARGRDARAQSRNPARKTLVMFFLLLKRRVFFSNMFQ